MSEPIDKTLEEYLGRESQLSKRYRALAADEVPAELDSLVLAQARQAVAAKPASSRKKPAWMRWTPPLALAASMVLVISIVIESGTQHEVTRDLAVTMPQSAPPPQAANDSAAKRRNDAQSAEPQQLSAIEREQSGAGAASEALQAQAPKEADVAPDRDPVTVELKKSVALPAAFAPEMPPPATEIAVPPPAPVSAIVTAANIGDAEQRRREAVAVADSDAASVDEIAVTSSRVQAVRAAGQGAGPRGTVTSPVEESQAREALLQRVRESDPQRWLEYIRELRRENKGGQADREWRSFIKAYPDYTVDEKDVARARQ